MILLFGEPLMWESALQLIVDVLLTNGDLKKNLTQSIPNPHLPIVVFGRETLYRKANVDMPRLSQGAFLECLEALYTVLNLINMIRNI